MFLHIFMLACTACSLYTMESSEVIPWNFNPPTHGQFETLIMQSRKVMAKLD